MTKRKWSLRMEDILEAIGNAKEVISCTELGKVLECSKWAVGSRLATLRLDGQVRRIKRGNTWYYCLPEREEELFASLEVEDDVEAWVEGTGVRAAVQRAQKEWMAKQKIRGGTS